MNCRRFLLMSAIALSTPLDAKAASVDDRAREARKACLIGELKKGVDILAELYLDTGDQNQIYNQGRCFEQNGIKDQAILRFQEYLRKAKNLPPAEVDEVQKKIDILRQTGDPSPNEAQHEPVPGDKPAVGHISVTTSPPPPPTEGLASPAAGVAKPETVAQKGLSYPPKPLGLTSGAAAAPDTAVAPVRSSLPWYRSPWTWASAGAVLAGVAAGVVLLWGREDRYPSTDMGTRSIGD